MSIELCGRDVVVDLTGYAPHDTVEMGNLVSAVRQFAAEGGHPVVLCPQPGTRILLETTGIDRTVPVVVDMATAQAQFDENR
jgi:anti-anti-sigma regulatory factor